MTAETDTRLLYMANQIARNFEALGHDNAVAATADHMLAFWDPRMKARIAVLATEQAGALTPIGAAAVDRLLSGAEPAPQTRATRFAAVDEPGGSDAG
ncbi:formate dehydrogenase subunit delta [Sphingomonas sp. SRS2]|uniref:formate dehydrogenase subunit delta n=1 Tax=Sphingomonas sp. SRS2 TaxID=133190 RepID=UPI000A000A7D|nr:formate dehydrogenase subunit delta [Sphingomonas sp. SRS2]